MRGEITIGFSTTTEDAGGEIVQTTPVTELVMNHQADKAMASREITQIPMYSAVKALTKMGRTLSPT